MNAYEIKTEYEQINSLLETLEEMKAAGEDVTEFEADTKKYIEELDGSLYEKADNIAMVLRNLDVMITGRREEAKRLTAAAKTLESRADYIKNTLLKPMMAAAGKRKLECKTFTVSPRKSTAVEVSDEDQLPLRYIKVKEVKSVDKVALKKWLSESEENVTAGASLIERESVQVK
jgi:uncharacterized protein Yka (UPF0111/DUF47 family)